jgi:hypothetical protein
VPVVRVHRAGAAIARWAEHMARIRSGTPLTWIQACPS